MGSFLKKLVPENVAGIIGLLQALLPLVRELIIVVIRILAILMPKRFSESMIVKTSNTFASIIGIFEKVKNFFL